MQTIENKTFGEERALYGSRGLTIKNCRFEGPADGESALKECEDITAEDCFFDLRYPLWHVRGLTVRRAEMTERCRAALWYSSRIGIYGSTMYGIKALRECRGAEIEDCGIRSPEFGWSSKDVVMRGCKAEGEYFFLRGENLRLSKVDFKGKYSFQYVKNAVIEDSVLETKDAFWHCKHVTVKNCTVRGEYLGWYTEGLTFLDCTIVGTQPLCYCKGLRLENCKLLDADLAFEKSSVRATLTAPLVSIKNPRRGVIKAPAAEEIVLDDPHARGKIVLGGKA